MKVEDHTHETDARLQGCIDATQNSLNEFKVETSASLAKVETGLQFLRDSVEKLSMMLAGIEERQSNMNDSLARYNNIRGRVDRLDAEHEKMHDRFISRKEFNAAMQSIRSSITMMQWIFGIGSAAVAGLLAALLLL